MKGWPIFSDVLVWFVGQLCSKYIHSTFSTLNLMCNITFLLFNNYNIGNFCLSSFQNYLRYFDINKINPFQVERTLKRFIFGNVSAKYYLCNTIKRKVLELGQCLTYSYNLIRCKNGQLQSIKANLSNLLCRQYPT